MQMFRGGKVEDPQDYKGPRDAEGIVNYLKKKALPATSALATEAEVSKFGELHRCLQFAARA